MRSHKTLLAAIIFLFMLLIWPLSAGFSIDSIVTAPQDCKQRIAAATIKRISFPRKRVLNNHFDKTQPCQHQNKKLVSGAVISPDNKEILFTLEARQGSKNKKPSIYPEFWIYAVERSRWRKLAWSKGLVLFDQWKQYVALEHEEKYLVDRLQWAEKENPGFTPEPIYDYKYFSADGSILIYTQKTDSPAGKGYPFYRLCMCCVLEPGLKLLKVKPSPDNRLRCEWASDKSFVFVVYGDIPYIVRFK
jgi:hypothetical protein